MFSDEGGELGWGSALLVFREESGHSQNSLVMCSDGFKCEQPEELDDRT